MNRKQPLITVTYILADGKAIQIEVTKAVAAALQTTDNKLRAIEKQDKRHIDFRELEHCEDRLLWPPEPLIDYIVRHDGYEQLRRAIDTLPEIQRRRLTARFLDEKTCKQIAEAEKVRHQAVSASIRIALKALKKIL